MMQAAMARIDAWFSRERPDFYARLRPGLDDVEWEAFVEALGIRPPDAMRALYRWRDGQSSGTYENFIGSQMFMPSAAVLEAVRVMRELVEAGEFAKRNWWHPDWIPFLDNGGGDHWVVDTRGCIGGEDGQIVYFDHEEADREVLYPNLETFLNRVAQSMVSERWVADDESWWPEGGPIEVDGYPRAGTAG